MPLIAEGLRGVHQIEPAMNNFLRKFRLKAAFGRSHSEQAQYGR